MNDLTDLLVPACVLPRLSVSKRVHVISELADRLGEEARLPGDLIAGLLMERERLGGTGVGEGVAIPHARIPGLPRPMAAFARLAPPIEFDAIDGRPVDLVFALVTPETQGGDHLKALARVARFLRSSNVRERLRAARGGPQILAAFAMSPQSNAA
jgi:PTS system nitrogen regulatory IIA component